MALITIKITGNINNSVQVGDTLFCSPETFDSGFDTVQSFNNISKVGPIEEIRRLNGYGYIYVDADVTITPPAAGDFLFFSKSSMANISSLLGYYAEIKMINDSTDRAEIFNVSAEIAQSSK